MHVHTVFANLNTSPMKAAIFLVGQTDACALQMTTKKFSIDTVCDYTVTAC